MQYWHMNVGRSSSSSLFFAILPDNLVTNRENHSCSCIDILIYQPGTCIFCLEFYVTLRWKIGVAQGEVASGFKWGCANSFGAASFGSSMISFLLFISLVWNFFYCCTNLLLIWILEEFQIPANIFATGKKWGKWVDEKIFPNVCGALMGRAWTNSDHTKLIG